MKIRESSEIEVFANDGGTVTIRITDLHLEKTAAVIDPNLIPVLCRGLKAAAATAFQAQREDEEQESSHE